MLNRDKLLGRVLLIAAFLGVLIVALLLVWRLESRPAKQAASLPDASIAKARESLVAPNERSELITETQPRHGVPEDASAAAESVSRRLGNPEDASIGVVDYQNVEFSGIGLITDLESYLNNPKICPRGAELSGEELDWIRTRFAARKRVLEKLHQEYGRISNEWVMSRASIGDYVADSPSHERPPPGGIEVRFHMADGRQGKLVMRPGENAGVDYAYREIQLQEQAVFRDFEQLCSP
jgi:hypothetical protein